MGMMHGKFEGGAGGDHTVELAVDELGRLILSPDSLASLAGGLTNAQLRAAAVDTHEVAGSGAVEYLTSTAVKTGSWRQVHCLTDSVFAVFSRTGATGSITGITLPAGTLLIGPVTAITLTSGAVAAYT